MQENKETPFLVSDLLPPGSLEENIFDDSLIPIRMWSTGSPWDPARTNLTTVSPRPIDVEQSESNLGDLDNYWSRMDENVAKEKEGESVDAEALEDDIVVVGGDAVQDITRGDDDDDIFSDNDLNEDQPSQGRQSADDNEDDDGGYEDDADFDGDDEDIADNYSNIFAGYKSPSRPSTKPKTEASIVGAEYGDAGDGNEYDDEDGDNYEDDEELLPHYSFANQEDHVSGICENDDIISAVHEVLGDDASAADAFEDGSMIELVNEAALHSIEELSKSGVVNMSEDLVKGIMDEYSEMLTLMESPRQASAKSSNSNRKFDRQEKGQKVSNRSPASTKVAAGANPAAAVHAATKGYATMKSTDDKKSRLVGGPIDVAPTRRQPLVLTEEIPSTVGGQLGGSSASSGKLQKPVDMRTKGKVVSIPTFDDIDSGIADALDSRNAHVNAEDDDGDADEDDDEEAAGILDEADSGEDSEGDGYDRFERNDFEFDEDVEQENDIQQYPNPTKQNPTRSHSEKLVLPVGSQILLPKKPSTKKLQAAKSSRPAVKGSGYGKAAGGGGGGGGVSSKPSRSVADEKHKVGDRQYLRICTTDR